MCNFLKMNFHPVIFMMCNDVHKAFKLEPCRVYLYFFHLVFSFPCLWKVTNGKNRSKKSPNLICSLLQIWLECISLVLLDLPCYHHETEVVLLNVNTSIHTRNKIWSSLKFNHFFIFHFISLIWYSVTLFYECIYIT